MAIEEEEEIVYYRKVIAFQPRGAITVGWVAAAAAMALVTVTTIVGNAVVMQAVRRARRAPSHFPLASLVAADLLIGVSVLPIAAARELFIFHLPWPICACWSTLDVLGCTASILSLCALGWERWCGITAPLARARRHRRAKLSAALVWPVSTVIALPTAFIPSPRHFFPGEVTKACTVNTNTGYVFTSVSFSFYLPASVMLFLYARILRSLAVPPSIRAHRGRSPCVSGRQSERSAPKKMISGCATPVPKGKVEQSSQKMIVFMTPKRNHLGPPRHSTESCPIPSPLKTSSSPGGILPRQRRATHTIVRLMSLFLICWTPFFVMLPVDSLCECVSDSAWLWCTWLGYVNSALNPLVYAVASPSVRRALQGFTSSSSVRATDVPLTTSSSVRATDVPLTNSSSVRATDVPLTTSSSVRASDVPLTTSSSVRATDVPLTTSSSVRATDVPLTTSSSVRATEVPQTTSNFMRATEEPLTTSSSARATELPLTTSSSRAPLRCP